RGTLRMLAILLIVALAWAGYGYWREHRLRSWVDALSGDDLIAAQRAADAARGDRRVVTALSNRLADASQSGTARGAAARALGRLAPGSADAIPALVAA